jgi:predicted ATPase/DNA-binding SARP family transcriptional activator
MVNLSLLGPFQADLDGQPVHSFKAQKAKALLIYLAVESHHSHQRESLMTMLWPGFALQSAQQNLRQTLYLLRQSLPIKDDTLDLFLVDRYTISWNPDVPLSLDITQFEELAVSREITDRRQAADLYRGPFLADFYLPDSEPFEEWVTSKRAYYFNTAQDLIGHLADDYIAAADWHAAEEITRRLIEIDKLQEPAHRQLIEVLARSGRRQDAIRQYNALRQLLKDELALKPDPETISLVDAIREGSLEEVAAKEQVEAPAPVEIPPVSPRHNLPHSLANFIGRQQEIEEIESLIRDHRLVMLTGAAGIGKTNLCLKVGRNLIDDFPDGVWMVELAPVNDPAFIPQAVASAMGVRVSATRSINEVLLDVLSENQSLLILDNCEHLIEDAAQFAESILTTTPNVRVLASSLEPFDIPGEMKYPVPPLSNPETSVSSTLRGWEQFDALRLFVTRAKAVAPEFEITEENIGAVVQICQRLDGIPLALELAAARVNVLSVADIAARLDDRFSLLIGGSRTAMPRHQTLRGMMEWSWDLLSQPEKDLLQRLSVFAGGMSLQAVEGVCCGEGIDPANIIELLTQLVNKSFVVAKRQPGQEIRYYLLETIRQYGIEQLEKQGLLKKYRNRHLATFVQLAAEAEPKLISLEQGKWIQKLSREIDNLRAALSWAKQTDIDAGIQLISTTWRFWAYAFIAEGGRWIEQLLAQAEDNLDPAVKANALLLEARLNMWPLLDMKNTRELATQSLSIYQNLGDQLGIGRAMAVKGWSHYYDDLNELDRLVGQSVEIFQRLEEPLDLAEAYWWLSHGMERDHLPKAVAYLEKSLALFREIGHLVGIVNALENLAQLALFHGDFESPQEMLEEALSIHQDLGNQGRAHTIEILGHLYTLMGEYDSAREILSESIALSKQNGEKNLIQWATIRLAYVLFKTGELDQAHEMMQKTMLAFKLDDIHVGVVFAAECLASLMVNLGQDEKAVRFLGWADKQRQIISDRRPPVEEENVQKVKSAITEVIGEEAFNVAYGEGQSLTTEQVIELAMQ